MLARTEGVPVIRHIAITLAALAAWALRSELRVSNRVLWLLAAAASVNLLGYLVVRRPFVGRAFQGASPFLGLAGWAALLGMTGGVRSPFVAGLWLEIILSAMTFSLAGIVLVTLGAAGALWIEQAIVGLGGLATPMGLQTAFLLVMGTMTVLLSRGWARTNRTLSAQSDELSQRLRLVEGDLEEVREVGKVGETAARLAHGYKNAAHTLRGFASLLDPQASGGSYDREALRGLMTSIDRLDDLARLTLDPRAAEEGRTRICTGTAVRRTIEDVIQEIRVSHPEIHCGLDVSDETPPEIRTSPEVLREILLILLRNAVEAMQGQGEVVVETRRDGDRLQILVRDHGCGVQLAAFQEIFKPGVTTKPGGSGFGLYLARKLVEAQGGVLTAVSAAGGGAQFAVTLPAARS